MINRVVIPRLIGKRWVSDIKADCFVNVVSPYLIEITLNRPAQKNALGMQMLADLNRALDSMESVQ